jgi:hypothetical protein
MTQGAVGCTPGAGNKMEKGYGWNELRQNRVTPPLGTSHSSTEQNHSYFSDNTYFYSTGV